MRPIRVGVVGLGHNGTAHLHAHRELGKSEIVALCDRNPERLAAAGQEFGVEALYTDDRFFAHPGLEAVSINTGDAFHREPFVKALQAGKHLLIEKPLANTEEDVLAMVEARRAADPRLKVQVGYILRFNPVYGAIHRLAREGRLGDVYYMEGDYIHNLLYQAEQTDALTGRNWYLEEEIPMVGGGSHPLDLLRWISGKQVVRVWTYGNHVAFPAMHADDCQVALFGFEDGTIAKVAALYAPRCAMAPFYNLRVYGTSGTVERDSAALSASPDDVHPSFAPVEADRVTGHPYTPEIEDWLDAIRDDRPVRCDLYDGANSTMAALCAVRASREGKEVAIPVFAAPE
jgi:predicted dehydrogenase